ncbi:MAG: ABC transporter ATP-binding protein [Gammaproteobacteria bacterium]|nr:ABC transporter ATP-binding protein [Gammaproteobacteria bacterium]MDX2460027.1 ABC transporter ATP-binding protein [Gammaproteobacteria bacterium]
MTTDATVTTNVIEVENLSTFYGKRQILRDVTLSVEEGEILVIMGGSGSGKSTLLRYMLALERPTSGRIRVLGRDMNDAGRSEVYEIRKNTGVAFQSGALFSSMSVGDNIMLPLREHTDLDDSIIRIMARLKLEVVELAGFEDLMPSELSGGMLKRAALARAVVMDPKLLFCDEPSAGLDPVVAAAIDDLILRLRDALRITIIIVTHELESAFKIADRIAVLDKGEILIVGTVDEVRACEDLRVQNLLNRRVEEEELDPEAYLRRLTGARNQ